MPTKECCRTCNHCQLSQSQSFGWCRLRDIKVHQDIASFAFCYHWTKKSPALPKIENQTNESMKDLQLEFNKALVGTENI